MTVQRSVSAQKTSSINSPSLPEELYQNQFASSKHFLSTTDTPAQPLIRSSMYVVPSSSSLFERIGIPLLIVVQPRVMDVCVQRSSVPQCAQCRSYACQYTRVEEGWLVCHICGAWNRNEEDPDLANTLIMDINEDEEEQPAVYGQDGEGAASPVHIKKSRQSVLLFCLDCTHIPYYLRCLSAMESIFTEDEPCCTATHALFFIVSDTLTVPYTKDGIFYEKVIMDRQVFLDTGMLMPLDHVDAAFINRLRTMHDRGKSNLSLPLALAARFGQMVEFTKVFFFTRDHVVSEKDYSALIDSFMEHHVVFNWFGLKRQIESPLGRIVVSTNGKSYECSAEMDMDSDHDETTTSEEQILRRNIKECMESTVMYNVRCEVRASDYVRRNCVYANSAEEMAMSFPIVHMSDNCTVGYSFYVDGLLGGHVHIQCVLYYSSAADLRRKALIVNLRLKTSSNVGNIYNGLALDVVFGYYVKVMATEMRRLAENRKFVMDSLVHTLKTYRSSTQRTHDNHLVLPESIKNLPVLVSALFKNRLFSTQPSLFGMRHVSNWPLRHIMRYFYPRMFSIDKFYETKDLVQIRTLRLSYENLKKGETYVIENGQTVYFYLLKMVDGTDENELEELIRRFANEEKPLISDLKEQLEMYYERELLVRYVRSDSEILGMMVEDQIGEFKCYSDFLCEMHYKIRN